MLTETNVVSRDPQLRSARVLCVSVASLVRLARAMAEEFKNSNLMERSTCVGGPLDVNLQRVWRTRSVCFNVKIWPHPAYGSWIQMISP